MNERSEAREQREQSGARVSERCERRSEGTSEWPRTRLMAILNHSAVVNDTQ